MADYVTTIGLEIHAELKTRTKMFCHSKNDPDEDRPNVNVCPICLGHPGTLPTINREAVKHVLKVGVAIDGKLADFSEFDRKNYFYPDIPKGYQISQYKYPLVTGGELNGVKITRVHLEEDTARSSHNTADYSLVDFNRAGLPLMELVTEPVIHSAKDAANFARELQLLLRYLGASDANMEKGEMRVEANISVTPKERLDLRSAERSSLGVLLGTKVEVKNLNSFRAVEKAICFEVDRHIDLIERGERVSQETRGWDENKQQTFSQRAKEDSHDYRYFPDPDLPKLKIAEISEFQAEVLRQEIPELPSEKRVRLKKDFGLKEAEAEIFVDSKLLADFFETVIAELKGDKKAVSLAVNYIVSDLVGLLKKVQNDSDLDSAKAFNFSAKDFGALIKMLVDGELSSRGGKDILSLMFDQGGDPKKIATEKGLLQKSDEGALKLIAEEIVKNNPQVVIDYKAGKNSSLQYLIGQAMKKTKGSGNPTVLKKILESLLY